MAVPNPLLTIDTFVSGLPESGRSIVESQAVLSWFPDRKFAIGMPSSEKFHELYVSTFSDVEAIEDAWFARTLFLISLIDYLIWSSLDPSQVERHASELKFHRENSSDTAEVIRGIRDRAHKIWSEKQNEWEQLKRDALSFAGLDVFRNQVFLEGAERLKAKGIPIGLDVPSRE